jgi:hypothetical protein
MWFFFSRKIIGVGCVCEALSDIIKDLISTINYGFENKKPLQKTHPQSPVLWNSKT